jgi:hypothetical protein
MLPVADMASTADFGGVQCSAQVCSSIQACCVQGNQATCSSAGSCGDGGVLACDGPEDCSGGSPICCMTLARETTDAGVSGGANESTACAGSCPGTTSGAGTTTKACHTDNNCTGYTVSGMAANRCCSLSGIIARFCAPPPGPGAMHTCP